jgi:hypothetical protein
MCSNRAAWRAEWSGSRQRLTHRLAPPRRPQKQLAAERIAALQEDRRIREQVRAPATPPLPPARITPHACKALPYDWLLPLAPAGRSCPRRVRCVSLDWQEEEAHRRSLSQQLASASERLQRVEEQLRTTTKDYILGTTLEAARLGRSSTRVAST